MPALFTLYCFSPYIAKPLTTAGSASRTGFIFPKSPGPVNPTRHERLWTGPIRLILPVQSPVNPFPVHIVRSLLLNIPPSSYLFSSQTPLHPQNMSPLPSPSHVVATSRSTSLRRRPSPLTLSSIKEHPDPADLDAEDEAAAYQLKIIPDPDCKRQLKLPRENLIERRVTDNRYTSPIFLSELV